MHELPIRKGVDQMSLFVNAKKNSFARIMLTPVLGVMGRGRD